MVMPGSTPVYEVRQLMGSDAVSTGQRDEGKKKKGKKGAAKKGPDTISRVVR